MADNATKPSLPNKVLLVDDDTSFMATVEEPLLKFGIRVFKAKDRETAFYHFNNNFFEVAIVELEFGPLPGLVLVQKWREHEDPTRRLTSFIVASGQKRSAGDEALIRELTDVELIVKPFNQAKLLSLMSRGFHSYNRTRAYMEMKTSIIDYYTKSGDFDKAAKAVEKKLPDLGSKGLETLLELYEKAQRYEDALRLVESMLEKNENNIQLLGAKGRLLMRLGRFADAEPILEQADRLAPLNINRIANMADLYLQLRDPKKSVAKFKELVDLSPENPDKKFDAFQKISDGGFEDEAIAFAREVAKPDEIVRHYNNKGVLLARQGDAASAIDEYLRALKLYPDYRENARIHWNLALGFLRKRTKEDSAKALEHLDRCLKLDPKFAKAQAARQQILRGGMPEPEEEVDPGDAKAS